MTREDEGCAYPAHRERPSDAPDATRLPRDHRSSINHTRVRQVLSVVTGSVAGPRGCTSNRMKSGGVSDALKKYSVGGKVERNQ